MSPPAFGDIAENHHMLAGQAIGLGRKLHAHRHLVASGELPVALVVFLDKKQFQDLLELHGILIKAVNGFAYQLGASYSEELFGGRIRFATDSLVIEDQDRVERILEYGLKLAFGGIECALKLALFLLCPKQELREEHDYRCKSGQQAEKQGRRQLGPTESVPKG